MSRNGSGFGKFLLGLGIGAGLGVLFAPKSGKETREDLKKKFDELVVKVKAIDPEDVKADILQRVEELRMEIATLDREKALEIARVQAKKVGKKAEELYDYAKEKSTPVVEKAVKEVKEVTLKAAKEVVNRLEEEDKQPTKVNVKKAGRKPKKA